MEKKIMIFDQFNYTDLNTMHHDLNYDAHGGKGALSVIVNIRVMQDDYTLIGDSFGVAFDTGRVRLKDKLESLAVGVIFSIITAPKSVVYWLDSAAPSPAGLQLVVVHSYSLQLLF